MGWEGKGEEGTANESLPGNITRGKTDEVRVARHMKKGASAVSIVIGSSQSRDVGARRVSEGITGPLPSDGKRQTADGRQQTAGNRRQIRQPPEWEFGRGRRGETWKARVVGLSDCTAHGHGRVKGGKEGLGDTVHQQIVRSTSVPPKAGTTSSPTGQLHVHLHLPVMGFLSVQGPNRA